MTIPAVLLGPDERFELLVSVEGILPIPEKLRRALHLEPGEIVSVELLPGSLCLETYSAFLDVLFEAVPLDQRWDQVVEHFLSRTLATVEERGLSIPADLFPLRPGQRLILQVLYRGLFPELYLYPADIDAVRRDLAIDTER
jgi:hypothetical protein